MDVDSGNILELYEVASDGLGLMLTDSAIVKMAQGQTSNSDKSED